MAGTHRTYATILLTTFLILGSFLAVPFTTHAVTLHAAPCHEGDTPYTNPFGAQMCTHPDAPPATASGEETQTTTTDGGEQNQGSGNIIEGAIGWVANGFMAAALTPVLAISFLILTLASAFLWLAGVVFNWTVAVLVFQFATYLGNTSGMLAAWGVLRDFGNILLLFGFVYMGIQTILQIGHYSVGRALSRLVIFAILLNFSLFVAEAVIDASNVLASTMYNQTYATSPAGERCVGQLKNCHINDGIASPILQMAGIGTVLSDIGNQGGQLGGLVRYVRNPIGEIIKFLLLATLITTAAVVLFAGAFLIISRAIHLAFLMVTSPIGFAGMAVPWLEKIAGDWWDQLIKQSLFAPVFLILIFVGLKLAEGLRNGIGSGSLVGALTSSNALATGPILVMVLVIGFMIGAMLIAKQFGIYGADAVTKWGTGVIGRVAGASTLGVAGWTARRTLGSASMAAGRSLRTGRLAGLGQMAVVGRMLTGVADAGARSSYDGRGSIKSAGPLSLGGPSDAAKKGRKGELEATVKAYSDHKKSMTEQDELDFKLAEMRYGELEKKLGPSAATLKAAYDAQIAAGLTPENAARAVGGANADEREFLKQRVAMDKTVTGAKKNEEGKKEGFDESVSRLKEIGGKLEKIGDSLKNINGQLTNPNLTQDQRNALQAQQAGLIAEQNAKENEFSSEYQTYTSLRNEIKLLRQTIAKRESVYRGNVSAASLPNVAGLSPLDRQALREAALSMKKQETAFKPKNLDDALGKALNRQMGTLRGRGVIP